jgi:phosphatidylglycerophosphate synthase
MARSTFRLWSSFRAASLAHAPESCYTETRRETKTLTQIGRSLRWNFLERTAFFLSKGDPTLQGRRDILFLPIATKLVALGLTANALSLFGLMFAACAALFITRPLIAGLFLGLSLFLDGLDGVVARMTKTANPKGEVLDVFCDTFGVLIIMVGLAASGYLSMSYLAFYSVVLVAYTVVSTAKSEILLGKFRSIGSRVVITSYVALCLVAGQFMHHMLDDVPIINIGVLVVTVILLLNLIWDGMIVVDRYVRG